MIVFGADNIAGAVAIGATAKKGNRHDKKYK